MELGVGALEAAEADVLVLPVAADVGAGPAAKLVDALVGGTLDTLVGPALGGGLGRRERAWITAPGLAPRELVVIGLGRADAVDGYLLRNLVEVALRGARGRRAAILLDDRTLAALGVTRLAGRSAAVRLALEGAVRAARSWGHGSDAPAAASLAGAVVATDWEPGAAAPEVAADAQSLGSAAAEVRAWQWAPSNALTPLGFAEVAGRLAREAGLTVEVLEAERLRAEGYGGIAGVAQGSADPPCLVVIHHLGRDTGPVLGLVGKGVTFDAGGMALKPPKDLHLMKTDMSGAAAVLGACLVIARWRPALRVLGVLPLAANVLGTGSLRPGDVITMADGTPVEVTNPDAEGRLLLADGIVHARRAGATHLVSVGTLTDAVSVAQGPTVSGLMGTDGPFLERVVAAAAAGGERLLRLALYPEYDRVLDSDVARLRNEADDLHEEPVAAALFLCHFAEPAAFAHLDIGGSASNEHANLYDVVPRGPSAAALPTLAHLARTMAEA